MLCLLPAEGLEQHPGLMFSTCSKGWGFSQSICAVVCRRAEDALSLCQQRKGLCQPLRVQPLLMPKVCALSVPGQPPGGKNHPPNPQASLYCNTDSICICSWSA
uniref:Uncharacterized protein n=1 Tax=Ficedula albicollis TaxID=59894 RepID=A0A803W009_FICAL